MKNLITILSLVVCTLSSWASNQPASATKYQTLDLKQFDNLKDQSDVKLKVGMTCKSESGTEYKAGDLGYEQCLKHSTTKTGQQSSDLKDKNSDSKNTGSLEVTF